MPESPEYELAKTALSVARESVAKQQADVRELRTSAAALLTGTAVVVSFLGSRAVDVHRFTVLVVLGVVFFVLSLVAIFTVLIPIGRGIEEIGSGSDLLDPDLGLDDARAHVDACERLAVTYDTIWAENRAPKRRLVRSLLAAAALMVLEILAWGLTILLAAGAPTAPAASVACTPATVRGTASCLSRGQACDRRNEREYERYALRCAIPSPGRAAVLR